MVMQHHSSESEGVNGALRKAWLLNKESRFNILSITHYPPSKINGYALLNNPMGSRSVKSGYVITVETIPKLYTDFIPSVIEA